MSQLLIFGSAILAADPVETADDFTTADQIIPKHVIKGYQIVTDDLPALINECEWDGAKVVLKPRVIVPSVVPQSVTMRQARLALLGAGLLGTVETAIAGAGPAAKIEWEYAQEVQRSAGLVPAMAAALGMTPAQIDALFVGAATL